MQERVWLRRRGKEGSQARSSQRAVLPASFILFFFENSLDMHLLGRYNIYLTKLNGIVIRNRRQKLVPAKAGNRRRRTDDRIHNRQTREPGEHGAREQDISRSGNQDGLEMMRGFASYPHTKYFQTRTYTDLCVLSL